MAWIDLFIAGLFEVFWAAMMKLSHGFSKLGFSVATVVGMILSFYFLAKATKMLPISLSYPIWTGIGAVGSILVGAFVFKDTLPPATWIFIGFLLVGIIGIKVTSGH
ncbi:QacE family quaternary ammonium compound efflux SMR transporter [Lentilactobacillus curieae]|uniref:QacE family quaternary ammonium compound efflux SMR transporter n=1 Tax=Lentilactobacillus curieae TaxID=1138822 RepID=A0A1S6QFW4_9LACO|nr:multidrug efflux SMR transporter [Lentilactobacillus curieae]AQW20493.1 QacE family quaternary ammonium compound efflux SMR transporter [Lentilactobacillus curieae]